MAEELIYDVRQRHRSDRPRTNPSDPVMEETWSEWEWWARSRDRNIAHDIRNWLQRSYGSRKEFAVFYGDEIIEDPDGRLVSPRRS